MTTPSSISGMFHTFHSITNAVPTEITTQILSYVIADAQPSLLGGSITAHTTHHPIASVSQTLRAVYLDSPISTSTRERPATLFRLRIGEALRFGDLKTLAAFFQRGPGQNAQTLRKIRCLSVYCLDDHSPMHWWPSLYNHCAWLQLCCPYHRKISSIDEPELWSLLKIRKLLHWGHESCIAKSIFETGGCPTCRVPQCSFDTDLLLSTAGTTRGGQLVNWPKGQQ